jgi:proteasome accessory factor B
VGDVAGRLAPAPTAERGVVLVRAGAGHALRRDAESITPGVAGPDERTAWDRVVVSHGGPGLADDLLSYGPDVYVAEPPSLRERVVARLRAAVEQAS